MKTLTVVATIKAKAGKEAALREALLALSIGVKAIAGRSFRQNEILTPAKRLPNELRHANVNFRQTAMKMTTRFRLIKAFAFLLTCLGLAATAAAADKAHTLFNGKDLTGWRAPTGDWHAARAVSLDADDPKKFSVVPGDGVLVNGAKGKTVNLLTRAEFGDVEAHIEFCISEKSNSGIYLMGRYEVQVYDSHGVEKDKYPGIECGGIYPRWVEGREVEGHSPCVNASKPPGEWQTFDIVFRAPRFDASGRKIANAKFVKVVHNGKVIHENVELTGPTRGARFNEEKPTGPLLLQGDHGPVAYRNLHIKPVNLN